MVTARSFHSFVSCRLLLYCCPTVQSAAPTEGGDALFPHGCVDVSLHIHVLRGDPLYSSSMILRVRSTSYVLLHWYTFWYNGVRCRRYYATPVQAVLCSAKYNRVRVNVPPYHTYVLCYKVCDIFFVVVHMYVQQQYDTILCALVPNPKDLNNA